MKKKEETITQLEHIILDLDETLIKSQLDKDGEKIIGIKFRPHLKDFLNFLFKNFKSVNIWSAGGEKYVMKVIEFLKYFLPKGKEFGTIFTQKNCEYVFNYPKKGFYQGRNFQYQTIRVKNLSKMYEVNKNMNKFNTMIVDDTEDTFRNNYGNAIHITPFFGKEEEEGGGEKEKDNRLLKVAEKLYEIKFKKLDFRKWKNREIYWDKVSLFKF